MGSKRIAWSVVETSHGEEGFQVGCVPRALRQRLTRRRETRRWGEHVRVRTKLFPTPGLTLSDARTYLPREERCLAPSLPFHLHPFLQ